LAGLKIMMGHRQVEQAALFYEFSLERHIPTDHLVRSIDRFVEIEDLRRELAPFYSNIGRPSIDPELMIRMLLIGYCFGIRSERRLCDEVRLNLAYRWFCRLGLGAVPDHSTFSKNRHGRFRESDLFRRVFETVLRRCVQERLVGGEGFAVDASLIKADANRQKGVEGEKGLPAEAAGRAIDEYLAVLDDAAFGAATEVTPTLASGTAERRASERMLKIKARQAGHRITAGEDKAYDTANHVANLRAINVTPHVTQNNGITKTGKCRRSAIDQRTTRHPGYGMSQSRRAMTECIFGWGKQHGTMRKTKHRGIRRVATDFVLNLIAYNLIRIPKLVIA
jgi:transposase